MFNLSSPTKNEKPERPLPTAEVQPGTGTRRALRGFNNRSSGKIGWKYLPQHYGQKLGRQKMNRAIASARGAQGFCGDHRNKFAKSMAADGIGVDGLPIRLLQTLHNASAS